MGIRNHVIMEVLGVIVGVIWPDLTLCESPGQRLIVDEEVSAVLDHPRQCGSNQCGEAPDRKEAVTIRNGGMPSSMGVRQYSRDLLCKVIAWRSGYGCRRLKPALEWGVTRGWGPRAFAGFYDRMTGV